MINFVACNLNCEKQKLAFLINRAVSISFATGVAILLLTSGCRSLQREPPSQNITASFQLLVPTEPEAVFTLKLDSLPSGASVYALNDDLTLGKEYARTPLKISIGMAQESFESESGRYLHKNWHVWNPEGMIRLESYDDGTTSVRLTCALYKEGFATEKIVHEIFELSPGSEYPDSLTLTIPLLTPGEAIQRDLRQLQEMQLGAPAETPPQTRHPTIIWQDSPAQSDETKSPR